MMKSAQALTRSSPRSTLLLALFVALVVIAYATPWLESDSASLSLTAYDLAEWSSLVPGVRFGAQPMMIPGLLRAQLIFAAALIVLLPAQKKTGLWWICGAVSLAVVGAQLPPFEYFLDGGRQQDVNYGQQFTFALLALIDALVCWLMPRGWPRRIAILLFCGAAAVTAIAGVTQAVGLAASFDVPAAVGLGAVGYLAALFGIALFSLLPARK